jgi:hypothetical protein
MTLGISKAIELVVAKFEAELKSDRENFERRAAEKQALIDQLRARASADPPTRSAPTARQAPTKARPSVKAKTTAVKNATPRRPASTKRSAKAKRSNGASPLQPKVTISPFREDENGVRTRTLTSVGAEEAAAARVGAA